MAFGLVFAPAVICQGAPAGPMVPQPGVKPEPPPPSQSKNAIHVQANEVVAPVVVTDKNGQMMLDLTQRDFHVFDDGTEVPIQHFGVGGEPLSIVLLVENSARITPLLPAIRKAAVIFAQPVMGETAEGALMEYDDSVRTLVKFTTNPEPLEAAIRTLQPGNGGANLYDAMERGISLLAERPQGQRRILLVVGEAQDTGSGSKLGEVLRRAQVDNVAIYSVGLSTTAAMWRAKPPDSGGAQLPPLPTGDQRQDQMNRQMQMEGGDLMDLAVWLMQTGKNAVGPNALAVASKSTGGLHMNTLRDRSIERAMDAIGGELHAEYTVAYQPPADKPSGYHEIRVTVDRGGVNVRTRPGYFLAAPGS
ncbi:MAG TPA: VWA domain-containing protein [Candidatus Acidoferrales bacterium]